MKEFQKHDGGGLLKEYNSYYELFQSIYPDYPWNIFSFAKLPNGYIDQIRSNTKLQEEFVKYLEKIFNIKKTSDWYNITASQVNDVLTMSLYEAMSIVKNFYTDLELNAFQGPAGDLPDFDVLRGSVPKGFWNSKDNQVNYMNWLAKKLDIRSIEDWYRVTYKVYIVTFY